jgi:hypothetical protein
MDRILLPYWASSVEEDGGNKEEEEPNTAKRRGFHIPNNLYISMMTSVVCKTFEQDSQIMMI